MVRLTSLFAVLLLASGAAVASVLEDSLRDPCATLPAPVDPEEDCLYQFDGGEHGDASDDCSKPNRELAVGDDGTGLLVPVDDTLDFYRVKVASNATLSVTLSSLPWHKAGLEGIGLVLYDLDCSNVLAVGEQSGGGLLRASAAVAPGTYTFLVHEVAYGQLPVLPGLEGSGQAAIDIPMRCHGLCIGTVNGAGGYAFGTSG